MERGSTLPVFHQFRSDKEVEWYSIHENYQTAKVLDSDFLVITDYDSRVYLNGVYQSRGTTELSLSPGNNEIAISNPKFGIRRNNVTSEDFYQVWEEYRRPNKLWAQVFSTVPGLSQTYKKQYLKASAFVLGTAALGISYLNTVDEHDSKMEEFNLKVLEYNATSSELQAYTLGNEINGLQSDIKDLDSKKNILIGVAAGLYALNILDGFISKPDGGFRPKNVTFEMELTDEATVRIKF